MPIGKEQPEPTVCLDSVLSQAGSVQCDLGTAGRSQHGSRPTLLQARHHRGVTGDAQAAAASENPAGWSTHGLLLDTTRTRETAAPWEGGHTCQCWKEPGPSRVPTDSVKTSTSAPEPSGPSAGLISAHPAEGPGCDTALPCRTGTAAAPSTNTGALLLLSQLLRQNHGSDTADQHREGTGLPARGSLGSWWGVPGAPPAVAQTPCKVLTVGTTVRC